MIPHGVPLRPLLVALVFHAAGVQAQSLLVADAGPDTVRCHGSAITIGGDPSASGGIPTYQYAWAPPLGLDDPTLPNPVCTTPNTITYTLLVTDASGSVATDQVTVTVPPVSAAELGAVEPAFLVEYNGQPTFSQCTPDPGVPFNFFNAGTVVAGSTFLVDWGDGSPPYSAALPDWTATHVYATGMHDLAYTVSPPTGCPATTTYRVFVGTSPTGGFTTEPNTALCAGEVLSLYITNTGANADGTNYIVDPGDGGPDQQYPHPPPPQVDHLYLVSSCPEGSFTAHFSALNPCGETTALISPIRVSEGPVAAFTLAPADTVCVDVPVTFTDASAGQEAPLCAPPPHVWSVSPNTVLLIAGSLGNTNGQPDDHNAWTPGSTAITLYFVQPGVYTVTDLVGNGCGSDSTSRNVVVDCITGIPGATVTTAMQLLPNPATDACVLQRADPLPGELIVRDATGRTVGRQRVGSEVRIPIDLQDLRAGSYAVELRTGPAARVLRLLKH